MPVYNGMSVKFLEQHVEIHDIFNILCIQYLNIHSYFILGIFTSLYYLSLIKQF